MSRDKYACQLISIKTFGTDITGLFAVHSEISKRIAISRISCLDSKLDSEIIRSRFGLQKSEWLKASSLSEGY